MFQDLVVAEWAPRRAGRRANFHRSHRQLNRRQVVVKGNDLHRD